MPIPNELENRGHCSQQFKPNLQGAIIRKSWCPWNADFIDEPPRISLEEVLGQAMPSDVLQRFHSAPDEIGEIDWIEIDRCPLRFIDSRSPEYDAGWLAEVFEAVSVLNMGAPSEWLPVNPSAAFRDAIIVLKSEQDAAAALRSKNDEDW
jgi:hypothetical protein